MVFSLVLGVSITAGVLGIISMSHTDSDVAAISVYQACPAVTRELGTPLERIPWTMSCGEYEGGSGHADSNWTIRVRGPKGTASGWYHASHTGGPWDVERATLTLPSGSEVDAAHCAPAPTPGPSPAPSKPSRGGKRGKRR